MRAPLLRSLVLFLVAASGGALPAQDPLEAARGYVQIVERVAPHVHLLRQAEPNFAGVVGNVVVVEQRDGLVVIDAGASHGAGERIVRHVRALSTRPVKAVVLTHWHGDHVLGLSAIVAAWPQAAIISHHHAAADIDTLLTGFPRTISPAYEAERIRSLGKVMDDLVKSELEKATTPEEQRGWRAALIGNRALRFADVAGTRLVLPTRTVTDSLTLPDPDAPIVLRHLGRANTTGDLVAWLPRQRVVATGDVVVEPVPFMINVFPSELVATLGRISALPYAVLLPGHGRPQRDRALLDRISSLVRDAVAQVTPLVRAGVATDSIPARVDLSRHRVAFAGTDPWLAYWFAQYTVGPLVESAMQEVRVGVRP